MKVKDMKVADVIKSEQFAQQVMNEVVYREDLQTRAIAKFGALKRTPLDRLRQRGVFNEKLVGLYEQVLSGTLLGYSRAERDYIKDMGRAAYQRTLQNMMEKEKEEERK